MIENIPNDISQLAALLPDVPVLISEEFPVVFESDPEAIRTMFRQIKCTGLLNAMPLGHFAGQLFTTRIVPNSSCGNGFAVVNPNYSEALTLSAKSDLWAYGLMAWLNFSQTIDDSQLDLYLELGLEDEELFLDEIHLNNFLEALVQISKSSNQQKKFLTGLQFEALGKIFSEPFWAALGVLWKSPPSGVIDTPEFSRLVAAAPSLMHKYEAGFRHLSHDYKSLERLLPLVMTSDDTHDCTYAGLSEGPTTGTIKARSTFVLARNFVNNTIGLGDLPEEFRPLLNSMGQLQDSYIGNEHFELAKKWSKEAPNQSFVLVCNASVYYSQKQRSFNEDYFDFAKNLATEQGWEGLLNFYAMLEQV